MRRRRRVGRSCRRAWPPTPCLASAEDHRDGEAAFGGFLIFRVHLARGQRHRVNRRVEIHPAVRRYLIAGDEIAGPGLDCAEGAAFDTWDLDEASDRIA